MEKIKLAICIEDEEYEARFVKCIMKHYKQSYEIYVFDSISEIQKDTQQIFGVIITGDGEEIGQYSCDVQGQVLFVLQDEVKERNPSDGIFYTDKYQEVYKIMEEIEKIVQRESFPRMNRVGQKETELVGIYSLGKEVLQMPFSALLAEVLSEKSRVLIVDIQPYSGLWTEIDAEHGVLGMEDMIAIATMEVYTNNRLAASIGHEQKWDYVYPMRNAECLAEASEELYQKMINILRTERGYERIVLNFGGMFSGMLGLMESCQQFYFLTAKKEERNWREEAFLMELQYRGKEAFLQKMIWMELPTNLIWERSWRQVAKDWLWGEVGDRLREMNWVEKTDG